MSYANVFELIATEFPKRQIRCVLVGGFAVNFYKVTRNTTDVDFMIVQNDLEEATKILLEAGYTLHEKEESFVRFKGIGTQFMNLDLLLVERETLEELIKTGKEVSSLGHKFIIPSIELLIALKLHAIKSNPEYRELKDLLDIMTLITENNLDVHTDSFKALCLRYGNEKLYEKITSIMKDRR